MRPNVFALVVCCLFLQVTLHAQTKQSKQLSEQPGMWDCDVISVGAGYSQYLDDAKCPILNAASLSLELGGTVLNDHLLVLTDNRFSYGLQTNNSWMTSAFRNSGGTLTSTGTGSVYDLTMYALPVLYNNNKIAFVVGAGGGLTVAGFPAAKVSYNNRSYGPDYGSPVYSFDWGIRAEAFLKRHFSAMLEFRNTIGGPAVQPMYDGIPANKVAYSYEHIGLGIAYRFGRRGDRSSDAGREENSRHRVHNYSEGRN